MKILSRDFTRAEKILIAVLALILLGLAYYQFVDRPVRQSIANAQSEADMLQSEVTAAQARLAAAQKVKNSLDELEASGQKSWMGSYNNGKAEVAFLNDILADTLKYSVTFSNVTRNGNQIRRNFSLRFQTANYPEARDVITRLLQGENRCLMGDMKCSVDESGTVTIDATATFYETMVDGIADAVLPSDSAQSK